MTIHEMLSGAGAELRAMEMKIEALTQELRISNQDNDKLREGYARAESARIHAQADLIHYQNIFAAKLCVEAMNMCQDFFNVTHANMKIKADEAIQRMVEEKLDKEREESAAKPASDIDDDGFNKPFQATPEAVQESIDRFEHAVNEAPAKSSPVPQDGAIVQAPFGMTNADVKRYYRNRMGQLPPNWEIRPIFRKTNEGWVETKRDLSPPSFLSKREPREDLRGSVSRLGLMLFGG